MFGRLRTEMVYLVTGATIDYLIEIKFYSVFAFFIMYLLILWFHYDYNLTEFRLR